MSTFVPDIPVTTKKTIYFEDATSAEGWQGQSTTLTFDKLKSQVREVIEQIGGTVDKFLSGTCTINGIVRDAYQVLYFVELPNGSLIPGRVEVAALPIKMSYRTRRSENSRREQSRKMALFMLIVSLKGARFLAELSPGYAPLMPFIMLPDSGKTISETWTDRNLGHLLTTSSDDVNGSFVQISE